ncbi:MAG TPA: hypothetical protein VFY17_08970 [Pilimelia sp.]|nr:hypothetical protein [Pilimelia sp.]
MMQVTLSGLARTTAITALGIEMLVALYSGVIAIMVAEMSYAVDAKDSTDLTVTLASTTLLTTAGAIGGMAAVWLLGRPRHDRWARGALHAVVAVHAAGGVAALLTSRLWGVALILVAGVIGAAIQTVSRSRPRHP